TFSFSIRHAQQLQARVRFEECNSDAPEFQTSHFHQIRLSSQSKHSSAEMPILLREQPGRVAVVQQEYVLLAHYRFVNKTTDHLILECEMLKRERNIKHNGIIIGGETWPPTKDGLMNKYLKVFTRFIKGRDFKKLQLKT
ncbi:hypothetical protein ANN_08698, partial [Periplaneta americana]